ncbi:hypothetical protein HPB47_023072 [Ixodes persulcatus]|uniref:Uncharacterized protein n=1 Tax=Ixodes persulcatus TaxID=34615 RepID=A0AC60Q818_IXOPE|nr:hypothetical protein HPB47_023072 [Ixodes persulcatus]
MSHLSHRKVYKPTLNITRAVVLDIILGTIEVNTRDNTLFPRTDAPSILILDLIQDHFRVPFRDNIQDHDWNLFRTVIRAILGGIIRAYIRVIILNLIQDLIWNLI